MGSNVQRLQLLNAITSALAEAAEKQRLLHTARLAAELASRFPDCGMTLRRIEDEIIRQVGIARGAAEMGESPEWLEQPRR